MQTTLCTPPTATRVTMATPNITSGLTESQISAVRESFSKVVDDWNVFGVDLFIMLFTEYSRSLPYFKSLKDMSLEQIRVSKALKAHLINFKHQMIGFIDTLDEPEVLKDLVEKVSRNHFRRGVTPDLMEGAFECFKNLLKAKYHTDLITLQSWDKTLATVTSIIFIKMAELKDKAELKRRQD